jgi:hypothetical protein
MVDNDLEYQERLNNYLIVKEAAEVLRKHSEAIHPHIKKDGLPAIENGRSRKTPSPGLPDWYRQWTTRKSSSPDLPMDKVESPDVQTAGWPHMKFETADDRLKAVDAFISHIYQTTGKKIAKKQIWEHRQLPSGKLVGYSTKRDFYGWLRGDKSIKPAQHFETILTGKLKIV